MGEKSGLCISTIQAAYKTKQFIDGSYQAQYQFKIIYRVPAKNADERMSADEVLDAYGAWAEANVDSLTIADGIRVRKVKRDHGGGSFCPIRRRRRGSPDPLNFNLRGDLTNGEYTFTTTAGQTVARELLLAYLNTGTSSAPVWSVIGKRVEDSSEEYDWSTESKKDILGDTYGTMKKPVITQSFEPCELDSGDAAQQKIWKLAVVDQDAMALAAMDMLIVHTYAGFAERYESCMVEVTGLGGEGGGSVGMPINVTYGGTRTKGTATKGTSGAIEFTPET